MLPTHQPRFDHGILHEPQRRGSAAGPAKRGPSAGTACWSPLLEAECPVLCLASVLPASRFVECLGAGVWISGEPQPLKALCP